MKKSELAKIYSNFSNISQAEADHRLTEIANLIEDVVSMGETFVLPGVISIGTRMTTARNAYDFNTGEMRITTPKRVPHIKPGARLRRASEGAPIE